MKTESTAARSSRVWITLAAGVLVVGIAYLTSGSWWPRAANWVGVSAVAPSGEHAGEVDDHGHTHGDHEHGHDDANSLELSEQAMGNIGLTDEFLQPVALETFRREITIPAIVVERPGQTRIQVSTPMAGVILRVHAVAGEAVRPGAVLFELRITAEELVDSQTEFLKTIGDLDVEKREIARLIKVTESGAIPQKTLLDRQYAKEKLDNLMLAQRESLRLHGLSEKQINEIAANRKLFRDLRIVAPQPGGPNAEMQLTESVVDPADYSSEEEGDEVADDQQLIMTNMPVYVGQTVAAGTTLAELANYSELYVEGRTFERDAKVLSRVAENGWKISALFEGAEGDREIVPELQLVYSAAAINVESRTLPFYVRLPNVRTRTFASSDGHNFIEWKYRPGRRVQLLVPVEEMPDQIVLPVEAIAREGAESYVFQQNGDHFDRVPVRITYRDARHAVVANDGSIFPGDVIARLGAHQMLMALKNKSGGGADPHAGHNH